jgi:hypothetical protein
MQSNHRRQNQPKIVNREGKIKPVYNVSPPPKKDTRTLFPHPKAALPKEKKRKIMKFRTKEKPPTSHH